MYKSKVDKKIGGVCGGIAAYFEVDATPIRLVWGVLTVFTAFWLGLIAYIVAAIIMPSPPEQPYAQQAYYAQPQGQAYQQPPQYAAPQPQVQPEVQTQPEDNGPQQI